MEGGEIMKTKDYLTDDQIKTILNYAETGDSDGRKWNIATTADMVKICEEILELRAMLGIIRTRTDKQEEIIPF